MFRRRTPAPTPVPLTEADMDTVEQVARDAARGCSLTVRRVRGQVLLRSLNAREALAPLGALGYAAEFVDFDSVAVTGWVPSPGTATVQEIDARIAALEELRSEAPAANRLTSA
ncbi:hypothetical protein [Nocardiopsis baichengensis]|uniref:hypothetical protein n=1 Tax=Nocardiopsis baichengensis TaxID=280240 RepID=UPI00034DBA7B|nr:hypothetical protein [Nocardiopsis baichengensis]